MLRAEDHNFATSLQYIGTSCQNCDLCRIATATWNHSNSFHMPNYYHSSAGLLCLGSFNYESLVRLYSSVWPFPSLYLKSLFLSFVDRVDLGIKFDASFALPSLRWNSAPLWYEASPEANYDLFNGVLYVPGNSTQYISTRLDLTCYGLTPLVHGLD